MNVPPASANLLLFKEKGKTGHKQLKKEKSGFFLEQIEIGLRFSLHNVLPPSVSLYFVPLIDVSQIVHSLIFLGVVIIFFLYCYYFDSSTQQIVNDPTCKIINPDGDWRPVATM